MTIIQDINEQISKLEQQKKAIQKECNHPEGAREYSFHESTDEYGRTDGPGYYFVNCGLCEFRFVTDKKGGKPNDHDNKKH